MSATHLKLSIQNRLNPLDDEFQAKWFFFNPDNIINDASYFQTVIYRTVNRGALLCSSYRILQSQRKLQNRLD